MRVLRNLTGGAAAVFLVATTLMPTSAGAISVEVAKKMQRAPRKAVSAARTRQSGSRKRKGQWASRKRLFQKMRRQRREYGQRIRQEHKVTVAPQARATFNGVAGLSRSSPSPAYAEGL